MKIVRILILLISISICYISFSKEVVYTYREADSTVVKYFTSNFNNLTLGNVLLHDASTLLTSYYDKLDKPFVIFQTLSNTGLAHNYLDYNPTYNLGFNTDVTAFSSYINKDYSIIYPLVLQPYTNISYISGDKKEQHIDILFCREFLPRFFLSVNYGVDFSDGMYKRSGVHNKFFNINFRYNTKNERYGINACYFHDKIDVEENGGIVYDSIFINNLESDKSIVDVNLTNASNFIKSSGIAIDHYFNILPPNLKNNYDSLQKKCKIDVGRINYHLSYNRQSYVYEDLNPTSFFYQKFDPIINSLKTFDSIYFHNINNTLYWNTLGYKKNNTDIPFYLTLGLEHNFTYHAGYVDILTQERFNDKNYSNIRANAGIVLNVFRSTKITANAQIITSGYHKGDFYIDAQWKQFLGTSNNNFGAIKLDININRQSADWFEEYYYSNNFRWNNDFNPEAFFQLKGSYQLPFIEIGFKQTKISNYIYFGTYSKPQQFLGNISISSLYSTFNIKLNNFETIGYASLQTTNNDKIMHLPYFQAKIKLAYNIDLVKNISMMQPSIVVNYFTEYYADAYMPALRVFYLQDKVKVGNYPYIDLCVTFKIKDANIFILYTNMYSLTGDNRYYMTPHYPMRDSRLCLGVKWKLYK